MYLNRTKNAPRARRFLPQEQENAVSEKYDGRINGPERIKPRRIYVKINIMGSWGNLFQAMATLVERVADFTQAIMSPVGDFFGRAIDWLIQALTALIRFITTLF